MDELYALETWPEILFVTGILGGSAAWLAGRALAGTWRPMWHVIGYMLILGAAIRFVHFAFQHLLDHLLDQRPEEVLLLRHQLFPVGLLRAILLSGHLLLSFLSAANGMLKGLA